MGTIGSIFILLLNFLWNFKDSLYTSVIIVFYHRNLRNFPKLNRIKNRFMNSPFAMIIFGATGDLAHNKLIPSLFSLFNKDLLPKDFFIIGFSRRKYNDEDFRGHFKEMSEKSNWKE